MYLTHKMKNQMNSVKLVVTFTVAWFLGLGCVMGDFDLLFTSATEDDGKPPKVTFDYKLLPNEEVSKVAVKADGQDVIAKLVSYTDDEAKKTAMLFLVDVSDARRVHEMLQVKSLMSAVLAQAKNGKHNIGLYPFSDQLDKDFAPMGSPSKDVANKVKKLKAVGKNTMLYQSVIKAINELEKVKADRKALVVISDWQSEDKVWDAKGFTKEATKRLKDLQIVCHSIVLVHTEKSEIDVAEALSNAMHGQLIKVERSSSKIPSSFVTSLYKDLESGGSAQIDLIGREKAKEVVLSVEVKGGKTYTYAYDRTEKVNKPKTSPTEKILAETQTTVDALVKEAGDAIEKIDATTADVPAESKKIVEETMVKVTTVVDEAKKKVADAKLTKEETDEAVANLDKMKDAARLKLEDPTKEPEEPVIDPPVGDDVETKSEPAAKRLFGLPMPWAIGLGIALIVILGAIILAMTRKKSNNEDLGDFSINLDPDTSLGGVEDVTAPSIPELAHSKEFEFGNGTAICQTLPAANETVSAQLLFGDGGKYGVFPISKTAVRIGRGSDNDLTFKNDSVSRHHVEILCKRDGKFIITDLDSGNGLLVNGAEVTQHELRSGDSVEVGEVCFTFSPKS